MLPSLKERHRRAEWMDQEDLDSALHVEALGGLGRINRWSGSSRLYWPALRKAAQAVGPRPLRVLDLATGGGDVACALAQRAATERLSLVITGCDRSATALAYARNLAEKQGLAVAFTPCDVLRDPLPTDFDVIICSLFFHHLDAQEAVSLLGRMARATRRLILVNDLVRRPLGYIAAWLGTRLLSRSPVVHYDGPLSVAGAYTMKEFGNLAAQAGLEGFSLQRRWPFRMLLTWSNPSADKP